MIDMSQLGDWKYPSSSKKTAQVDPGLAYQGAGQTGQYMDPFAGGGYDASGAQGIAPPQESQGFGTNAGLLMPGEWDTSADFWRQKMQASMNPSAPAPVAPGGGGGGGGGGFQINTPSAWTTGMESLTPMSQTGAPVSSDAWWAATQGVTNRSIEDAIKNAAEQAGLGGMRWSTPLGYTAQDIGGKYMGEATQQWADREMAAQEAAKQRMLEATGQLFQYGQGQYQMSKDEADRRAAAAARGAAGNRYAEQMAWEKQKWADQMAMQGAGQLAGIGGQRADLGRGVASDLYGMGQGAQTAQQREIDAANADPFMKYAQDFLNSQPSGNPNQYNSSTGTDIAGIFGALAPYLQDALKKKTTTPSSGWDSGIY